MQILISDGERAASSLAKILKQSCPEVIVGSQDRDALVGETTTMFFFS